MSRSGVGSSVDGQICSSDVRSLGTRDERHQCGDFVHGAIAPERSVGGVGVAQSPDAGFSSVSMGPGWTLLTVMPRLPVSLARLCVNILTAPFVAA